MRVNYRCVVIRLRWSLTPCLKGDRKQRPSRPTQNGFAKAAAKVVFSGMIVGIANVKVSFIVV